MQSITAQLSQLFRQAIQQAFGVDADPQIGVAQNPKFGDYQANAAMGLSKQLQQGGEKTNPRAVAEKIKANLDLGDIAGEVSIAGPGFINVRLSDGWLAQALAGISQDDRLGIESAKDPITVVVDYSGPNVAKQMHVGHLRSTIIGDAISRVVEFAGHRVIRQNHLGDWGTQFGMLIAYLRSASQSGSSEIEDLEDFYRAAKQKFDAEPAFADEARQTVVHLQAGKAGELAHWQQIVNETRRHFEPIYQRLGVRLARDSERGESFYNPMLAAVVRDLRAKEIAVESEGAVVVFTPGIEAPLIVQKRDGGYLYGTTDLAAIRYRVDTLGAHRIIYTHDARQMQHFAQVFDTARRAGWAQNVSLEYAPFGTMLGADNRPFKTRSGDTVKLKDLIDEAEERALVVVTEKNPDLSETQRRQIAHAVGVGAMKYADLSKDRVSDYVFAWDKMLSFDGNTGPYLQNAFVRIHGIFRKAATLGVSTATRAAIVLEAPQERALALQILRAGDVVETVARELKPHHLCAYLYDLATTFHSFFEHCPVLQSADSVRDSRLALCGLTGRCLALGLELLGIEHPEQM